MVRLQLSSEQFKRFQENLESEQSADAKKNVQIWIESDSATASGGFGFAFDPFVVAEQKIPESN
ncbi:MAG: hypothetical protein ACHQQQ_13810 [Bacteroidota bacterium]